MKNTVTVEQVYEDAATKAFDAIAELCGCKEWEYPGQVVRDVERLKRELDNTAQERDARGEILDDIRVAAFPQLGAAELGAKAWHESIEVLRRIREHWDITIAERDRLEQQLGEIRQRLTEVERARNLALGNVEELEILRDELTLKILGFEKNREGLEERLDEVRGQRNHREQLLEELAELTKAPSHAAIAECVRGLQKKVADLGRAVLDSQNDYREMKGGRDWLQNELAEVKAKREVVVKEREELKAQLADAERRAGVWQRKHDECCTVGETDAGSSQRIDITERMEIRAQRDALRVQLDKNQALLERISKRVNDVCVRPFGSDGWCVAIAAEDMPFGFWVIPMYDEHAARLTADALRYMAGDMKAAYSRNRFGDEWGK